MGQEQEGRSAALRDLEFWCESLQSGTGVEDDAVARSVCDKDAGGRAAEVAEVGVGYGSCTPHTA
jgi:hypothetical protein